MFSQVWNAVVKGDYLADPAEVFGFVRRSIIGDTYPVVIPSEERAVLQGRIYFHVDQTDLARLDAFEGEYYSREMTRARLANGSEIDVAIYVMKPAY